MATSFSPDFGDAEAVDRKYEEKLEREWEEYLSTRDKKWDEKHNSVPKEEDFPCMVDGFHYESLTEYNEMSQYLEEADSEEYWFEQGYRSYAPYDDTPKQTKVYDKYSSRGAIVIPSQDDVKKYSYPYQSTYTPYVYNSKDLKVGEWELIEVIGHMNYLVVHAEDKKYYAVWLSLYKDAEVDLAMKEISKLCPMTLPKKQNGYIFHTSNHYSTYFMAKNSLEKGAESFYKIKKRWRDAKDIDWIPPNLREIGFYKMFHLIPTEWQKPIRDWVAGGCKGWNKFTYVPKDKNPDVVKEYKANSPNATKTDLGPTQQLLLEGMKLLKDVNNSYPEDMNLEAIPSTKNTKAALKKYMDAMVIHPGDWRVVKQVSNIFRVVMCMDEYNFYGIWIDLYEGYNITPAMKNIIRKYPNVPNEPRWGKIFATYGPFETYKEAQDSFDYTSDKRTINKSHYGSNYAWKGKQC